MNAIEKENKLQDIAAINFGSNTSEIVSCMEVLVLMIDIDDDKEVILACKNRLQEGVELLKSLDYPNTQDFE
ncbi:MAG: hypothetical protein ACPGJS_13580 [Flammeovirgaceae bacterium]